MRLFLCAFILAASLMLVAAKKPKGFMDTAYEWKYIDYLWDSESSRQQAIDSGAYNSSRILPMDVDKDKDGRIFISMLGMRGVPATLATVTDQMGPSGPLLKPYPDWSYFKQGDHCNSITNVYRIKIDECNRLWVLDTGYLENEEKLCEPQLLAFDLNTDRLISATVIPYNIARGTNGESLLATPIVETEGRFCEKTTVYMSDPMGRGLVIWNNGRLVRLENPVFNPDESATNITSGQWSMSLNGGIVTMDLSPKIFPNEERLLYFHGMASYDLYAGSIGVLKRSIYGNSIRFLGTKNILTSNAVGTAFSSEGTLFLGMTRESAIACWNMYRPQVKHNIEIVAQDDVTMQFASGMKVLKSENGEEIWALTNRFVRFQVGQMDFNEYNFRILKSPVERLIKGTFCEMPRQTKNALKQINTKDDDVFIFSD